MPKGALFDHPLNLRRSDPDFRDWVWKPPLSLDLPAKVDLIAPRIYDQGALGCHDDQTEVLTAQGWRRWTDYDGHQSLATVNQHTHALEYQRPSGLQAYRYKGSLQVGSNQSLDFAVTPNHRMYLRRWDQRKKTLSQGYEFRRADDIGWYAGLLGAPSGYEGTAISGVEVGYKYSGDDFIALVALIVSDGWVGGTDNNWNVVSFCCFRPDRREMVVALANRLNFREAPSRPGVWRRSDAALANWCRANLFTEPDYHSPFKRVPDIVKAASMSQVALFLRFFGDQHESEKGRQFYTSSPRMADDLQELLLRIGKASGRYERSPRSTTFADGREINAENCAGDITITEWQSLKHSLDRKANLRSEDYDGYVFCATVPNSTLITRRNGHILISGNSCTAQALANAYDWERMQQGAGALSPSRLFQYYNTRLIEGTTGLDSGGSIRDAVQAAVKYGEVPETDQPYTIANFKIQPAPAEYTTGLTNQVVAYRSIPQDETAIRMALAAKKLIMFGFPVYANFANVGADGLIPMPSGGLLGYHANLLCGYDVAVGRKKAANSWGIAWGSAGYGYFPDAYLLSPQLAFDFWVIDTVEIPQASTVPTSAQLWERLLRMRASATDPIDLEYVEENDIDQSRARFVYGRDRHDSNPRQVIAIDR